MNQQEAEFLERLRAAFRVEAAEHLQAISTGLLDLEKQPPPAETAALIETAFRAAHSLKGAARAVNLPKVEAVCQALESVLAALKRQTLALSESLFELLYETVDLLSQLLAGPLGVSPGTAARTEAAPPTAELIQRLEQAAQPPASAIKASAPAVVAAPVVSSPPTAEVATEVAPSAPSLPRAPKPEAKPEALRERAETIRIATARLDALLLQAEEMLAVKLATGELARELRGLRELAIEWERQWMKMQPTARRTRKGLRKRAGLVLSLEESARTLEFLDWNQNFVRALYLRLTKLAQSAEREHRMTAGLIDTLLADVRHAVMLPFANLLESFPKVARDLAHSQGKQAELVLHGGDIEIDRRVLEAIKDPLLHLVRNSIDHGLETPAERARLGKAERGTLTITAAHLGNSRIAITVSDDGAGIDLARVGQAAVKAGLLTRAELEQADEQSLLALLYHSGFSTSPQITSISGRGLGLAILHERVERLGGVIETETVSQQGTTFRLILPATLTTFRGVLLRCAEQTFVVPTNQIERVIRVRPTDIKLIEGLPTLRWSDGPLALVSLAETLELPRQETGAPTSVQPALILNGGGQKIAFLTDAILSEQEVIVKSLGTQLARVRNVAGATVLGTGQVALILNPADLMKSALRRAKHGNELAVTAASPERTATLLIAEDSVTSRVLLRGILENAGYSVRTAVDGAEAWEILQREPIDLLVSDAEMPRLNGFELTARVRADERLKELPVVLVTGLASDADRRRGLEAGANAYVVKSGFDKDNLLAVVERLL